MTIVKWALNRIRSNRQSRKAISTIMANLTMLVIVVFLSSLLFVWAVSSFGVYQGGAGYWFSSKSLANQERVTTEYVGFTGASLNNAKIYVRNVGPIPFTLAAVYLNSTLISQLSVQVNTNQGILLNSPSGIPLSAPYPGVGKLQTITLATVRGTTVTTTWVA